jgi:hypothetical protein
MDAILALGAVGFLILCVLLIRGASSRSQAADPAAWPLDARWDDKPALDDDWSVETHGWPPEGSPRWRLGGRISSAGGGDGMMSCGGAGGAGGGGGGDGGGC